MHALLADQDFRYSGISLITRSYPYIYLSETQYFFSLPLREPFKNYLADFVRYGGGPPPFPLSFFEHNDCPLRGGGCTPQFR